MDDLGWQAVNGTVYIFFTTHTASGAAVAPSTAFEAADVRLYKNGSATERSSQSGWTMTSPFDAVTGLHLLQIDLSDNADAGFYAANNVYTAVLVPSDETVDGVSVVRVLAQFRIGVQPANVTQFGGNDGSFASGIPAVNTTQVEGSDATNQIRDAVVDDATRIDASALNTLSGHDPGETIMGATDPITVTTNNDKTGYSVDVVNDKTNYRLSSVGVDDIADEEVEAGVSIRESLRLANSANAGKLSGATTNNVRIRDLADSKNRVDAIVDADGNRTAVTIDVS